METDTNIEIVMPEGMLGKADNYFLDCAMSVIAEEFGQEGEWATKYGVNIDNDIFMMHRYCWCESQECPWCEGCSCELDAWKYFKNNEEITTEQYNEEYFDYVGKMPFETGLKRSSKEYKKYEKEWNDKIAERNKIYRVERVSEKLCSYCKNNGEAAPNFYYKPLGLKVWWYKYIGRDMKVNMNITNKQISEMIVDCINSK